MIDGFINAISVQSLIFCLLGVLIGTTVGTLPGLGAVSTISMLIPATLAFDPIHALIFLSGIYFGAMYGSSTTAILLKIPGTAAAVTTTIDGYPMAKQGRAGPALVIVAVASFVAGTGAIVLLSFLAPFLANLALMFGPPEYFSIILIGLIVLGRITDKSMVRSYLLVSVGVVISLIGMDPGSGTLRLTFDSQWLIDGVGYIPIIMGLYGLSEVLNSMNKRNVKPIKADLSLRKLMPTKQDFKRSGKPIVRGGLIGFFIGLLPGPAAIISTFTSYKVEKSLSKRKKEFGKGAIEGVSGPEAANNAAITGELVPLLSLGIPFSAMPAVMLTAFLLHGITPGPMMITDHPLVFWSLIASFYIANIMLLILNVPFVKIFASILYTPTKVLMPLIMVFCFIGAYAVSYNIFDLYVLVIFSVLGFILIHAKMDPSPMIIGVILGPLLEMNFKESVLIFRGDLTQFFYNPISATILSVGIIVILFPIFLKLWRLLVGQKNRSTDSTAMKS